MRKHAKTEQKRSELPWHESPVALPDDFPVSCSGIYVQSDSPITYLHRHDVPEIGYCHRGRGIWVIGPKIIQYGEGDVVVITEDETHLAQSLPGTSSDWTWLYFDPARLFSPSGALAQARNLLSLRGPQFINVLSRDTHPQVNDLVRGIIGECRGDSAGRREAVRGMLYALIVLLDRLAPSDKSQPARNADTKRNEHARIAKAVEYVLSHYTERVDIDELAAMCNMSLTTFRRVFRRALGKSPQEYVSAVRLSMARLELESTDRKVSDIALRSGFTTLSAFNRLFRESYGATPREWRSSS